MVNEETRRRVWFITESSAGFGRALSEAVLARGDSLVGTARHSEQLQDLAQTYPAQFLPLLVDVTNQNRVQEAVQQAIKQFGRIDVLVNNAGAGFDEGAQERDELAVLHHFKAHLFGILYMTRAVLPIMQDQQSGHIFMHSLTGCQADSLSVGMYNGNTFAIEGLPEALAREVVPLGIRLTIIEQGDFCTHRTRCSLVRALPEIKHQLQTKGTTQDRLLQGDGNRPDDVVPAVQTIMKIINVAPSPLGLGADALRHM